MKTDKPLTDDVRVVSVSKNSAIQTTLEQW